MKLNQWIKNINPKITRANKLILLKKIKTIKTLNKLFKNCNLLEWQLWVILLKILRKIGKMIDKIINRTWNMELINTN